MSIVYRNNPNAPSTLAQPLQADDGLVVNFKYTDPSSHSVTVNVTTMPTSPVYMVMLYISSNSSNKYQLLCFSLDPFNITWGSATAQTHSGLTFYRIQRNATSSSGVVTECDIPIVDNPNNEDYAYYFLSGEVPPSDPYSGAGDSTTGGGDGTFDGSSDPVPVPNLPSVGAQDSGFITLFTPTASQMKDLAHYMWVNPLFDIETGFKKLFSDPMDCILGLSVVPVTIPTSGAKNVNIGNLVTSVTMNVASQQYIAVDCGTVTMDRFFGSYLDFEPYTKIAIFLPYCGTHALSMDDIAGKTIGVVYHIDILTGSCIAFVKCGDSVLYEFNGACSSNIPVNSLNFASTIENAIRIAVNIGTTVATAGASAPATTATELARQKAMNTARNISLAGSTAEGALSLKPSVSRSGALGGGVGILGHQIPYFIITRPRLCKPAKQDFFQGYPSFIQTTIGDLIGKGFTSFTNVIISGQYLTDEEETELENILESGVYL